MDVCTIIAKNYVAYARVLARSLAEHNPESRLWTLIIDDFSRYIDPAEEPFNVLTPADVGCEPFMQMALRYTVLELSTAVKPWLLRHLMDETGGPVTYLDPDIRVYGPLGRLDDLADRHGVALIPHNNAPIPHDGHRPTQVDIMIAGVYNLGYISLAPRPEVQLLLDWWADRLERDCRVDPVWGYFVDQRWFDLAPGFLTDLAIVREPEYNVAYWNLHSRRLQHEDGRYLVDGRPLAFFHFSGFDPEHPLALSRHQDRIDVARDPVLERLLADYAADVMAEGHAVSRKWPYSYVALGDGTRIDDLVRSLYDKFADEHEEAKLPSPFTLDGASVFHAWLMEDPPGGPSGINRVLARIYEERRDLQAAFPELTGSDRERLLSWAEEIGQDEVPLLAKVIASANGAGAVTLASASGAQAAGETGKRASEPLRQDPWGVNVVGGFQSGGELGAAARQLVSALDARGTPSLPVHDWTSALTDQTLPYDTVAPEEAPFPVNLLCTSPEALGELASQAGDDFFGGRYSIGLWFWDLAAFPDRLRSSFSLVQEVWAPSAYVAALLEAVATVPVTRVRIPVAPGPLEPRSRAELGLPDEKFLFVSSFDAAGGFARKNPIAAIEAFRHASLPSGAAQLVIHCINGERDPRAREELRVAAAANPDIEVIEGGTSDQEANSIRALSDCYVSLHRSEAFGVAMAEAMWLGKPVIATGYSGNLDFMTAENSLLVDYRPLESESDSDRGPERREWADPDVHHAAELIRRVFEDPDAAGSLGATAAADIRRTHSPISAGEIIGRRLESIRATGRARRMVSHGRERRPALAQAQSLIIEGPPRVPRGGRARRMRGVVRRAILRVLRPYTDYQQKVNFELVAALDELSNGLNRGVEILRAETAIERAQLMAELRRSRQLESSAEALDAVSPRQNDPAATS